MIWRVLTAGIVKGGPRRSALEVRPLGAPPSGPAQRERWLREVSTVAAYGDSWHIEGQRPLGPAPGHENHEQTAHRKRALAAGERAKAISTETMPDQSQLGATGRDRGVSNCDGIAGRVLTTTNRQLAPIPFS
jgi:hypothetical protein